MTSRFNYLFSIAVVAFGVYYSVTLSIKDISRHTASLQQILMPGTVELEVEEAATYTIYHEARAAIDGTVYISNDLRSFTCTLHEKTSRDKVQLKLPFRTETYTIGSRSGAALFKVEIPEAGTYELQCKLNAPNAINQHVVLAFGNNYVGGFISSIFKGIGIIVFSLILALAISIFTFLQRQKEAISENN